MGQPFLDITFIQGLLQVSQFPSYMGQTALMALSAFLV